MGVSEQIRIGVDSSEFSSGIQQIRAEAEALAQSMIRQAADQGKSGEAALKNIEDQIKALERRNKLESEVTKSELRSAAEYGGFKEREGLEEKFKEQKLVDQDQKLIVQLLKDLVYETREASLRDTSTQESIFNKEENKLEPNLREEQAAKSESVSIAAGAAGIALGSIMHGGGGDGGHGGGDGGHGGGESKTKTEKEKKSPIFTLAKDLFNTMKEPTAYEATLAAGKETAGLIAAQSGVIGKVGMALGATLAFTEAAFHKYAKFEAAQDKFSNISGYNMKLGNMGWADHLTTHGMSKIQALEEATAISKARGTAFNVGRAVSQSADLGEYGLDKGTIYGLANILRSNTKAYGGRPDVFGSSTNLVKWAEMAQGSAEESGVAMRGDTSILPEYLNVLIGIGKEQLMTMGEIDMGVNTRMLNSITHLDNSFKNPEVLQHVYSGLESGLKQSSDPNTQALQYSVMSRLKSPDGGQMSMWEMNKAMASPMQNPEYMKSMISQIKKMGGGDKDNTLFLAQSIFKDLSPDLLENIFYGIWDGGGGSKAPLRKAGSGKASDIEVNEAERVNSKLPLGEATKETLDKMLERLEDTSQVVNKLWEGLSSAWKEGKEVVKKQDERNEKIAVEMGKQSKAQEGLFRFFAFGGGAGSPR